MAGYCRGGRARARRWGRDGEGRRARAILDREDGFFGNRALGRRARSVAHYHFEGDRVADYAAKGLLNLGPKPPIKPFGGERAVGPKHEAILVDRDRRGLAEPGLKIGARHLHL